MVFRSLGGVWCYLDFVLDFDVGFFCIFLSYFKEILGFLRVVLEKRLCYLLFFVIKSNRYLL